MTGILIVLLLSTASCLAVRNVDKLANNHVSEMEMQPLKWQPKTKLHHSILNKQRYQSTGGVTGFSWKSCDTSSVVQVTDLKISPDPLHLPGNVNVGLKFKVSKPVGGDLEAKVTLKMDGYELPCFGSIGSCVYNDLCKMIQPLSNMCPDPVKKAGLNCACPVAAKTYDIPEATFNINQGAIPTGDYQAILKVTGSGASILCLEVNLSIA